MDSTINITVGKSMILAGSLVCWTASPVQAQTAGDPIPNSYICAFKSGPINVGFEAQNSVGKAGGRVTRIYRTALHGFAAALPEAAVSKMMRDNPLIAYCEQDRIATIPPGDMAPAAAFQARPGGGGGGTSPQTIPWGIMRVSGPVDATGKTAWVIDSGIDLTHPDLNVDTGRSKSFLINDSSPNDANGHGTHVAGIIAAKNNSIGVVGVAANASVVSLRVLDRRGSGANSGVIAALDYATAAGHAAAGDVINLSLITSYMQSMNDAVTKAGSLGIFVAIAAGNSAADASAYSPASASGTNVYTASAFQTVDTWAYFSNYGSPVDFSEPGVSILSTYKGGGYNTLSGTSMAAPHLAGILLANSGTVATSGQVSGDPDGQTDPIGAVK